MLTVYNNASQASFFAYHKKEENKVSITSYSPPYRSHLLWWISWKRITLIETVVSYVRLVLYADAANDVFQVRELSPRRIPSNPN